MKRIMSENKSALLSLRIPKWRTVKSETGKINDQLKNSSTNITELNNLIYAGAKLDREKNRVPLKTTDRKLKPGGNSD